MAFYVGNIDKIDTDGNLPKGIAIGKGCIRIKKKTIISEETIGEFIKKTLDSHKQSKGIGC